MNVKPSDLRKVATFITWAAIEPRNVDLQSPTKVRIHLLGPDQVHVLARLATWRDDSFEYEAEPIAQACLIDIGDTPTVWFGLVVARAGITYTIGTAVISQPHVQRLREKIPGLRDAEPHDNQSVTLDLLRELAAEQVNA